MRRTKPRKPAQSAAQAIEPTAVYTRDEAMRLLRLGDAALRREVREGRLRHTDFRQGQRYFFLGEWLLKWIEARAKGPGVAGIPGP